MQSRQTRLENRAFIAVALLGILLSLLDLLSIAPGWASRIAPLLVGMVIFALIRQRNQLDSQKFILRRIKRVTDDLKTDTRRSRKQSRPGDQQSVTGRPETYREIKWKGLTFRSQSEVKIAKALDHAGVLFLSSCKARLKTEHGRQSREIDFLIFHKGRWGILEVDGPHHSPDADTWRDTRFREHGIPVYRFNANQCYQQPKQVVHEFLSRLESTPITPSSTLQEVSIAETLNSELLTENIVPDAEDNS